MSETKEKPWHERARELGACAYSSIEEMVAALKCDYARLEDLRQERKDLVDELNDAEDAEEKADATKALAEWDEEYGDELHDLEADAGDCEDEDSARQRIDEDPLSLQVRSGWVSPGEEMKAEEFELLLGTGGPAVRIIGELDEYGEPYSAILQVQDWFQPWTDFHGGDEDVLLDYCRCFSFSY